MASVNKRKWTHNGVEKEAWIVRYKDAGDVHRQRTFTRKKEADAFRLKIENERAEHGAVLTFQPTTVKQLGEDYSRVLDRRCADGAIKRSSLYITTGIVQKIMASDIAALRLADLDADQLEQWFHRMRTTGGLSTHNAIWRLKTLATMLRHAIRRKLIRHNPAVDAVAAIGSLPKRRTRVPTPDEARAILAAAEVRQKRQRGHIWAATRIFANLAAFGAMREGEILALRQCDLDPCRSLIKVDHTINRYDELTEPKTKSSKRIVAVPRFVMEMVLDYVDRYPTNDDRGLIFRTMINGSITPLYASSFVVNYWHPLLKAAGLYKRGDNLHFHALRHFAASWWLDQNVPVPVVSRMLGHASPQITMSIYAHALQGREAQSAIVDDMAQRLLAAPITQELRKAELV